MVKLKILIATIIVTILFTGCMGPKTYDEVSSKQLEEMFENKESFVLVIGSETCSACKAYKIAMDKVIEKYGIDIKYIDISKLDEKEGNKLTNKVSFSGTPTTVFITKGEEKSTYNRINGNMKYSKIVSKLKENGYIKE